MRTAWARVRNKETSRFLFRLFFSFRQACICSATPPLRLASCKYEKVWAARLRGRLRKETQVHVHTCCWCPKLETQSLCCYEDFA